MKKLVFVGLIMLMMLPFASASMFSDAVHLARIRLGEWGLVSGKQMDSYVYVYNDNSEEKVRDGRISMTIMDEGVSASAGGIKIKAGEGKSQSFVTDLEGLPEGEYLVKVSFTAADGVRKTKYRFVDVE